MFSVLTDHDAVKGMISLGVNGFAFKNIKPRELAEIIRKILSGQEYYPTEFMFSTDEIETIKQQKISWVEQLTKRKFKLHNYSLMIYQESKWPQIWASLPLQLIKKWNGS